MFGRNCKWIGDADKEVRVLAFLEENVLIDWLVAV